MAVGNDIRYICLSTEEIGDKMGEMIAKIKKSLSGYALKFYEKEFAFFEEITGISGKIRWVLESIIHLFWSLTYRKFWGADKEKV